MSGTVGRFAPTPSGRMHLGNVLCALLAWLSVRSRGGRIVLRIEDLDPRARHRENALVLMDDLRWLGLDWDEGPYYQSERSEVYQAALERLREAGLTYPCFCTRADLHAASAPHASDGTYIYRGTCRNLTPEQALEKARMRPPATRLLVPATDDPTGTIEFEDRVFGPVSQCLARECGDFIVCRSDDVIAYQLAVVVDDAAMGVNELVRGRDLLSSTPRQIYLQRLLGYPCPRYAHIPLVVAEDGRRLSKRDRDFDLGEIRKATDDPRPVLGTLAYHAGLIEAWEPMSAAGLVDLFSWEKVKAHSGDIVVNRRFLEKLTL